MVRPSRNKGGEKRSQSPAPAKVHWYCLQCDELIEDRKQDSIECGICKKWCHKKCSKLSEERYKYLQNSGNEVLWGCKKCRESEGQDPEKSRLEAKVDGMMQMMTKLMTRLVQLEEERSHSRLEEKIDETIERKVEEVMDESRERDKRKMNVMFVNVPESEGDTAEERMKGDLAKVTGLVGKIAEVGKDEFSGMVRLGGKTIGSGSRPRMLRVTVKTEEAKKKLLMNARKLNEGVEASKRIYINQDRTAREREDFRRLRDELEKRRKEEPDLVIRGGRIVKGREGDQNRRGDRQRGGAERGEKE